MRIFVNAGLAGLVLMGCQNEPVCPVDASPQTLDDAVDLIGSLPRPVTVPCLISSLERPLRMEATTNAFSAQPGDPRNPRVFLFTDTLAISVVSDGEGSHVVEFGEQVDAENTLKGELLFPVDRDLQPSDPTERIRSQFGGSNCAVCHIGETETAAGFLSVAIKAEASTLMPLQDLQEQADLCSHAVEPQRCAVLDALFDGEVEHQPFPSHYPTIFDLTVE